MQSQGPPPYQGVTFSQRPPVAQPYRGDCATKSLKVTGILQIIFGGVSVVFGCVAAGITAWFSYIAIPIWGGLFFFVTTGILGVVSYWKPHKPCHLISYIILSIVSACLGLGMFVTYSIAAANERDGFYYYYDCSPAGGYPNQYCNGPKWSRALFDSLIVIVAALEAASAIVGASMAGYKMCACCRKCCVESSQQQNAHVMYHAAGGGAIPMVAVPANQAAPPIYVAGTGHNATSNPQGQQLVFAQPSRQFIVARPAGQAVVQASGPDQQFVVAQPSAQAIGQPGVQGQQFMIAQPQAQGIGQPALQGQQQFVVAQPIGQSVIQTNPQGPQVVATQYPAGQPLAQPSQPAATYTPYIIQAAPGQVNMQPAATNIQNPVQAQMQATGQTHVTGPTPQIPAVVQTATTTTGEDGQNTAADASQNPAMAQPPAPEEKTPDHPEGESLTLEASGQTSVGEYSDQSALI